MATKKLDLLDGIFSGDDRLWVNTFQVDLGEKHGELALFETMVYGPGARAGDHMLYTVEEQARVGHDAMLASYGYRRTGLRSFIEPMTCTTGTMSALSGTWRRRTGAPTFCSTPRCRATAIPVRRR